MHVLVGEPPEDPRIGFLPPNNGTTGQGFVGFTVRPKKNLPSLSRIDAQASIYFDKNEPIDTPPIFNTVRKVDECCKNLSKGLCVHSLIYTKFHWRCFHLQLSFHPLKMQ